MKPEPGAALTTAMVTLTLTTGLVEAVSFLALGPVFTAVQTGNLLFLGFALAGEGGFSTVASLASLAGFVVGALLGARLESAVDLRGGHWFPVALAVEAALLATAGAVAWDMGPVGGTLTGTHGTVTVLVAVAMGLRNVTTLRAKVPDLPTTVATRALTALLAPLALDSQIPAGARNEGRRSASVGAMFLGGFLGAWSLYQGVQPAAVLLAVAVLVITTGFGHELARRQGRRAG
ncbi:YoaK family protein [Dermacoccus nishinomiyaensis]|uniref:YoaK family protein n=1 Tax=Dermacoccus nishinomiyaensis TaxID=1274 RepID=UPI00339DB2EF